MALSSRVTVSLLALVAAAAAAQGAVLVWDHDNNQYFTDPEGNGKVGTEYAVTKALAANGVAGVSVATALPLDLSGYDAVFILCGFWPNDGFISYYQLGELEAYLERGGVLYLEGTDVARRYGTSAIFDYAGAAYADDGRPLDEGNVDVAQGIGSLDGMTWDYASYRKEKPDGYVDELDVTTGEVVVRSRRAGNRTNARVAWRRNDTDPRFAVIVSTFIFGALEDGANTKAELMKAYLEFFGLAGPGDGGGPTPASLGRIRSLYR